MFLYWLTVETCDGYHCLDVNHANVYAAVDQPPEAFDATLQCGSGAVSRKHQVCPPPVTATARN